jgi:hypothetical protein
VTKEAKTTTVPRKSGAVMELGIALTGDRRAVENLILDVRAIAQRCGLKIPNIRVIRESKIRRVSTKKKVSRKSRS